MTKIIFLFSFLFVSVFGFSAAEKRLLIKTQSKPYQQKTIDIESITEGLISEEMFYSLPIREKLQDPLIRFVIADSLVYAMEKCRLNVWQWKDSAWHNLYNSNNKGFCIGDYYSLNKELFGFTAGGFWSAQAGIYQFNEFSGTWELFNVQNKVEPFVSSASFSLNPDTIVSFVSFKIELNEQDIIPFSNSYALDIKNKKWLSVRGEFDLTILSNYVTKTYLDLENTFHAFNGLFHVVVDKKTRKVYFSSMKSKISDEDFIFSSGNRGVIFCEGEAHYFEDEIPNEAKLVGEFWFEELGGSPVKEKEVGTSWFWGSIFLVVGGSIGWFIKPRKPRKEELELTESSQLVASLMGVSEELISSEEIDEILGINEQENPDARRVKRSRIIHEVNQEYQLMVGKELITRHRDPKDKRYMLYRIKK